MSEEKKTLHLNQSARVTDMVKTSSGRKVVVACKLPHGIWLRAFQKIEFDVPVLGGGYRSQVEFREVGERARINGTARPVLQDPEMEYAQISSGYAITYGVDGDLWDAWLDANKDEPYVQNQMIFAAEQGERVTAMAKERRDIKSGLEPLSRAVDDKNRNVDKRWPQPGRGVTGVKADVVS